MISLYFRYALMTFFMTLFTGCSQQSLKPEQPFIEPTPDQYILEHKLLVIHVNSLFEQLAILEKSTLDYHLISSKKNLLIRSLEIKEHSLLYCAHYHQKNQVQLALNCAQSAHKIRHSNDSAALLKRINSNISKTATNKKNKQRRDNKKERGLLINIVNKQLSQNDYNAAIKTLNKLLRKFPRDKQALKLITKTRENRQLKINQLLTRGDELYKNEKVQEALNVWKTAFDLAPENIEVTQRISRAQKVLGSMNKLKSRPQVQQSK